MVSSISSIHLVLCRFCHCPPCSGPPPCRCPRSPSRCSPAQRAWWPGARPRTPHTGTPRAWNQVRNMEQGNRVWVASMSTTNGSCLLNQLFHFHKSFQSKIFFLSHLLSYLPAPRSLSTTLCYWVLSHLTLNLTCVWWNYGASVQWTASPRELFQHSLFKKLNRLKYSYQ